MGSVNAASQPVAAAVGVVQRGSISHMLSLAGQFRPYQVIDVHAKVSGYVRHIYVDIGDHVHAGQTLAVLEVAELSAEYRGRQSEQQRKPGTDQNRAARDQPRRGRVTLRFRRIMIAFCRPPKLSLA
jgi:multidrug efflux pump subunit AcrA (membrane-fusion protein)